MSRLLLRRQLRQSSKKQKKGGQFDKGFLSLTLVLTLLGIIAVADASAPQALSVFSDSFYFAKQQIIWAAAGIIAMFASAIIPYTIWKRLAWYLMLASVALLVAVLIPGVGSKILGARRWINLGPVSLQPSELLKLSLAIFFAYLAGSKYPLKYFMVTLIGVAGLVMLQPDLGTTIIILTIGFTQLFIAGFSIIKLGILSLLGSGLGFLVAISSDYRRQRLLTFLESSTDPLGSSYHIRQILIALGSGGLLGVGLGQSRQKYLFLPETATDSVFAVIAEEVGFLGASLVIVALVFFVFKAIRIAKNAPDDFSRVLGAGIAAWVGGQTLLNIASMVALTPLTGIPLPFFSYGGSSLTMLLLSVGILLNISHVRGRKS